MKFTLLKQGNFGISGSSPGKNATIDLTSLGVESSENDIVGKRVYPEERSSRRCRNAILALTRDRPFQILKSGAVEPLMV